MLLILLLPKDLSENYAKVVKENRESRRTHTSSGARYKEWIGHEIYDAVGCEKCNHRVIKEEWQYMKLFILQKKLED